MHWEIYLNYNAMGKYHRGLKMIFNNHEKKTFILLYFMLIKMPVYGQMDSTRLEDLTDMLGENYSNLINEELNAFRDTTDVSINLRIRYQNDYYQKSSNQYANKWKGEQQYWVDIVLETKPGKITFHDLKMEAGPEVDSLVSDSEREQIMNQTMIPEFHQPLLTNNNYYTGLSNGIRELRDRIGNSLNGEEDKNSLNGTLAITHLDSSFIPGEERLNIRYSIEEMEPIYAKMEVFALNEGGEAEEKPVFRDTSIVKRGTDVVYREGEEEGWSGIKNKDIINPYYKFLNSGKYLLQIEASDENNSHEVEKEFFVKSNYSKVNGVIEGDPVPNPDIVPSNDYGNTNGGRYGCTRNHPDESCGGNKGEKMHGGLDIRAKEGTEIRSITKGSIFAASDNKSGDLGYYVIIKSNLESKKVRYVLYAHLQESSDADGDIEKGDVIGKAGITGNAEYLENKPDRQHVHIIVKEGEKGGEYSTASRVDPENFLKTKFDDNGSPNEDV